MIESGAIVYALAEQCEGLMPQDRRTETLTWMFTALNTIELPLWNLFALDVLHGDEAWAPQRRPGAVGEVNTRLAALSECLVGRDYLLGRFTAADILMTTVLRFIRHTDLLTRFPLLETYVKRCEERPAFLAALRKQLAGYAHNEPVAV
jgi:glutathione S-transferase